MATSKPISTISYNTEDFLKTKLESWLRCHLIQTYQYIKHKGEDGDKDHIHLRIEPNKKLDPMDLSDDLKEFINLADKPLGCRTWRSSQEEDWFLYAVHDKDYLKIKYSGGEKGEKIPYNLNDIIVPEDYDLEVAFIRAKSKLEHTTVNLATRICNGETAMSLIMKGENPNTVNSLMQAISRNDYQNLNAKYQDVSLRYELVVDYLMQSGVKIDWDYSDGHTRLIVRSHE